MLVPVVWAGLSSLKPAAEITRFPPTLLPRAAVEQTVPGFDKPLSLWQVTLDGQPREMAMRGRTQRYISVARDILEIDFAFHFYSVAN